MCVLYRGRHVRNGNANPGLIDTSHIDMLLFVYILLQFLLSATFR